MDFSQVATGEVGKDPISRQLFHSVYHQCRPTPDTRFPSHEMFEIPCLIMMRPPDSMFSLASDSIPGVKLGCK